MTASTTGGIGAPESGPVEGCPLTAAQMAEQDQILAGYLAAIGNDLPPPEEGEPCWVDPDTGPPMGEDFWLGQLPQPLLEDVLARRAAAAGPEPVPPFPDVTDHDGTGPGGQGFESGSVLDGLEPGPVLAAALDRTLDTGLGGLSDDALAGVMLAARRQESRAAATLLAATAELDRRRHATADKHVIAHVDTEVAILLACTRRAAQRLLGFAADLTALPATMAALAAGRIDRTKAEVISYETGLLDGDLAAAAEQLVIEDAPRLTTTALTARLRRLVIAADPAAARRRVAQARREARVEVRAEQSGGTAALAGRDLPVAGALAADQRIDATARALKAAGATATLAQLRAAVFLALLSGGDPRAFLPPPDGDDDIPAPAEPDDAAATSPAADETPSRAAGGTPGLPGQELGIGPVSGAVGRPAQDAAGAGPHGHPTTGQPAATPAPASPGGPGEPGGTGSGWPGSFTLRGSVHLTLPLATWLGASRSPGEVAGLGPLSGETCQELADWIAQNPGSRWCLTLTGRQGQAGAHGCARRPPPPAADTARLAEWLARLKINPIQAGDCSHAREVPGYRIPDSLHHAVKVRQRTCANPICVRPAQKCDDDHTLPYDQGGRSCECDLAPTCRTDHRCKQAPGWRLEQPSPGVLIWHLPNGRSYTVTPDIYPT